MVEEARGSRSLNLNSNCDDKVRFCLKSHKHLSWIRILGTNKIFPSNFYRPQWSKRKSLSISPSLHQYRRTKIWGIKKEKRRNVNEDGDDDSSDKLCLNNSTRRSVLLSKDRQMHMHIYRTEDEKYIHCLIAKYLPFHSSRIFASLADKFNRRYGWSSSRATIVYTKKCLSLIIFSPFLSLSRKKYIRINL